MNNNCTKCKYEYSIGYHIRYCRRFPPGFNYNKDKYEFPEVNGNYVCGEFKQKPTKEQIKLMEQLDVIDDLDDELPEPKIDSEYIPEQLYQLQKLDLLLDRKH